MHAACTRIRSSPLPKSEGHRDPSIKSRPQGGGHLCSIVQVFSLSDDFRTKGHPMTTPEQGARVAQSVLDEIVQAVVDNHDVDGNVSEDHRLYEGTYIPKWRRCVVAFLAYGSAASGLPYRYISP